MNRVAAALVIVSAMPVFDVEPPITALTFTPDGKSVVTGSQSGVKVLSWPELKLDRSIATELDNVHDVAFSPDGKTLAIAGGRPAEKGTIELVDWPSGKLLHRLSPHTDVIHSIAWSADSGTLVTASADQTARVIDVRSSKFAHTLEGHSRGVLACVFLPGDKQVVTADSDVTLRVWDIGTGKLARNLSNHTRGVTGLAVRPVNDKGAQPILASTADDRTVRLWQPMLGRMMRFARIPSEPRAIAWTADGSSILVACKDGALRVIDPETVEIGATHQCIDGIAYSLALAPDGSILLGGQNAQLKRVRLASK